MAHLSHDDEFDQLDEQKQQQERAGDGLDEGLMKEYESAKRNQRTGSVTMQNSVMNENSEAVNNMEDALALAGGFGRFQWIMSFICMGNYVRSAFVYYPLPYLELEPYYVCTSATNPEPYECYSKDFCGDSSISYSVDWSKDISLHNWVEQLDLTCKSSSAIGLIGSSYFIGIMVAVALIPRLSDLYGRKWFILGCQLVQLPCYFWMFFMSTLTEAYIIFVLLGVGFVGSISINSLYLQEFMQARHRAFAFTIGQTFEGLTTFFVVIYFLYITKYWQGWYVMTLVFQILIIAGMLWLPESPEFYYAKGRFNEAKEVILHIGKINGKNLEMNQICFEMVGKSFVTTPRSSMMPKGSNMFPNVEEVYEIKEQPNQTDVSRNSSINQDVTESFASKKNKDISQSYAKEDMVTTIVEDIKHCQGTLRELWEDKDLVINLVLMSFIWSITSFAFYLGKFQLKYVGGNIFLNSVTSSISDTVARPIGYLLIKYFKAKKSFIILFATSFIGSFPVMFSVGASAGFEDYVVPVCLFIMNLGTSATFGNLYLGHMDLFPVVFSTTSMGVCNILARFCTVFAPIVAEIEPPTPEIIFTTLVGAGFVMALFVRKKTAKYY